MAARAPTSTVFLALTPGPETPAILSSASVVKAFGQGEIHVKSLIGAGVRPLSGFDYTSIRRALQRRELLTVMGWLAKIEMGLSMLFIAYGVAGLISSADSDSRFRLLCHTNIVAGAVGFWSAGVGLWAVQRYRWICLMVAYLILTVVSSVANLLVIIHSSIWLGLTHVQRQGFWTRVSVVVLLLVAVALGLCFIVSSCFICYQWSRRNKRAYKSTDQIYCATITTLPSDDIIVDDQTNPRNVGKSNQKTQLPGGTAPMLDYHICDQHCTH